MGIIRDDDAEIVLYNPFNGEPFFAYNKNTDKLDAKGKDLENLGSVKTDQASIKNTPVIDVTAWGAVGDGSADDTTAVQNAIDEAHTRNGEVLFPPGDYNCPGGLLLDPASDITLRGNGEAIIRTETLDGSDEAPNIFELAGGGPNITIEGLHLIGNANATNKQTAVKATTNVDDVTVRDCVIEDVHDGITALNTCNNWKILNNDILNCQDDGINPGGGHDWRHGLYNRSRELHRFPF